MLAYDVYVIGMIEKLQKSIRRKIENLEQANEETKNENLDKTKIKLKDDDGSGSDSDNESLNNRSEVSDIESNDDSDEEFQDILKFDVEDIMDSKISNSVAMRETINSMFQSKLREEMLLDDQDETDIMIRAHRIGRSESRLDDFTTYEDLEPLDLYKWNFSEFYKVGSREEEKRLYEYLKNLRSKMNQNGETKSISDEDEGSEKDEEFLKPDELKKNED